MDASYRYRHRSDAHTHIEMTRSTAHLVPRRFKGTVPDGGLTGEPASIEGSPSCQKGVCTFRNSITRPIMKSLSLAGRF